MSTHDPAFWVMVVTAVSFLTIAIAMIVIAVVLLRTTRRLEERVAPLLERVNALGEQASQLAVQGREIGAQLKEVSGYLSTATMHLSESTALVKDEVRELKQLVGHTALTARDKVDAISHTIDHTQRQIVATAAFINQNILVPAREFAAIMAGVRRTLEVLLAPAPKPVNQTYADDEMFIG